MIWLAFRNVVRRKTRTLMTICVIALCTAVGVAVFSVCSIVQSGLVMSNQRLGADVLIYPLSSTVEDKQILYTGVDQMTYMRSDVIDGCLSTDDIAQITEQFFVETKPNAGCCSISRALRIVGIDSNTDFVLQPWLQENEMGELGQKDLVAGCSLDEEFGSKTFILNNLFTVSGILCRTGTGMDDSLFIDIDQARNLAAKSYDSSVFGGESPQNLVTCFLIKLKPGVDAGHFAQTARDSGLQARIASISSVQSELQDQLLQITKLRLFASKCGWQIAEKCR